MTFRSNPTGKSDHELPFLCRPTPRPQASWTISHAYRMHVQKEFLILSPVSDLSVWRAVERTRPSR